MGRKRLGPAAAARKRAEEAALTTAVAAAAVVFPDDLKKNDCVQTVPSTKYPESVILTVDKILQSGNEFLIYFEERKSASEYAKYKNLGITFVKIKNDES
jgi:hypothetical protein